MSAPVNPSTEPYAQSASPNCSTKSINSSHSRPAPEAEADAVRSDSPQQTTGDGPGPGLAKDGYPPQRHAGAVGYGPEYRRGADFDDKIGGLAEELRGKVTRNPELVEHGRERRTGELKRKEKAQADAVDPPHDEDQKPDKDEVKPSQSQSAEPELRRDETSRAATTAPAGTQKGERQVREGNSDTARVVDEE